MKSEPQHEHPPSATPRAAPISSGCCFSAPAQHDLDTTPIDSRLVDAPTRTPTVLPRPLVLRVPEVTYSYLSLLCPNPHPPAQSSARTRHHQTAHSYSAAADVHTGLRILRLKRLHGRLRQSAAGEGVCAPAKWPAARRSKGRSIRKHLRRQSRHGWPLPDNDFAVADANPRPRSHHVVADGRYDATRSPNAPADEWL